MVEIKGVKKTSLIDYPKHMCSTLFLGGCNFKCGFCHNPLLVFNKVESVDEEKVIQSLIERKRNISAICITGGEPLMNKGIIEFMSRLKSLGFLVKIDTNGYFPEVLKQLIDKKLVDHIAMDIKSSPEKYNRVTGVDINIERINESVQLIKTSGINSEFRTTVVPGMITEKEITEIGKWLKGCKTYTLQQFRSTEDMIDESLKNINPYPLYKLDEFKEILNKFIDNVKIVN
ncbi:MAG: anaerobic ribonucleoside-triphosphate reductase activating protein [Nanoarchaeota archaeon]|nr:anaerobic ribonucleoside-triphosphate reductase activating protein [Nanoarchaeota archaeon]